MVTMNVTRRVHNSLNHNEALRWRLLHNGFALSVQSTGGLTERPGEVAMALLGRPGACGGDACAENSGFCWTSQVQLIQFLDNNIKKSWETS